MSFTPEEWVCILDLKADPIWSEKQISFFKTNSLRVNGIMCHEKEHMNSDVCNKIEAFPSLCHMETRTCLHGYRNTTESLDQAQAKANTLKRPGVGAGS